MKKELENILIKTYPNLFRDHNASGSISSMKYGFCYDDGWFLLTEALSKKLETLILEQPEDKREQYRASQCKEKFGILRWYMTAQTQEMNKAIEEAEALSAKTCERCGRPGELRQTGYWLKTECDICVLLK